MEAILALESGKIFRGRSFGASGERHGEVVFNTSLTGYQEILTDPSYKGQIVAMTYPLIGNYGVNKEDIESRGIFLEGFIVKERSRIVSNWRADEGLDEYLRRNDIPGIEGVDTRALTRHIRLRGAMKAVISTEDLNEKRLVKKAKSSRGLVGIDLVKDVTVSGKQEWNKRGKRKVVVVDCGVKYNILRELVNCGCRVTIVSAYTDAREILKMKPDGVLLSNGPGDPAAVPYVVETARQLLGKVPIFGICLGQQMLGLALGGRTYKLKFGHHGANQPTKDLRTGRIYITVQNHGFNVDAKSLKRKGIEVTHINLNDGTLEGIKVRKLRAFAVQFHPEASAGPHDARYLFGEFVEMMKSAK
ncbi:MAG: glutamine-hydrolyzing carbamoyl-phosphate synthase small subunit [Candidatus Omnitrophica bacterium]|nr:glutamine-hydrolyzing carbamoyl-phosphate synthase small subunit [Candidatus Omnitrophota bacterium]